MKKDETKEYMFTCAGVSPEFGPFEIKEVRRLPVRVGRVLVERGQAREHKPNPAAGKPSKKKDGGMKDGD